MPETELGPARNIISSLTRGAPPQPTHVLQQNGRLSQAPFGILPLIPPAHAHDQPLGQLGGCQDPICLADRKKLLEAEADVRRRNPNGFGPCDGQIFWELNSDKNLPACNFHKQSGLHQVGHCHWCAREIVSPLPQPGVQPLQRNAFTTCVCRIRVRSGAHGGGGRAQPI